ncbi:MAG: hypothetical protein PHZ07_03590 [Patescibacteria group bacterium]|nr:hypothetical protein [Patescibacteria group bacterium]MDD4304446.1 hypothetical protein [Patescibacteria group bacterium]MDD4695469.1 hypothetical protein [Patescibacteria group bacterium]
MGIEERLMQQVERMNERNKTKNETFRNDEYLDEFYDFALAKLKVDKIDFSDPSNIDSVELRKVFIEKYGKDDVENDEKYVLFLEKEFKEKNDDTAIRNKKIATILEAFLYNQTEQNLIFGMDVHTIATSKYDDYQNGVDTVLEMDVEENDEYEHLAIAYDATLTSDIDHLNRKINSIKRDIKLGKMTTVKYFKSENSDETSLENIPKLIIGMDMHNLEYVAKLWKDTSNEVRGSNQKILDHPFRFIVIDEILMQLEYFMNYANSVGQIEIAEEFKKLLGFFQKIDKDLSPLRKKIMSDFENKEKYNNDKVLQNLKEIMSFE